MSHGMAIGILAAKTRCTVPTIRYYEEIGLMREVARLAGGHRTYGDDDLQRLVFIRRCREFGFPIEQIRALVDLVGTPTRDCVAARDVAALHLREVRRKLKELKSLESGLARFVDDCTAQCAGGPAGDCVILDDLAKAGQRSSGCGSRSSGTARGKPRASPVRRPPASLR